MKIHHSHNKQRTVDVAILISAKTDFKVREFQRYKGTVITIETLGEKKINPKYVYT